MKISVLHLFSVIMKVFKRGSSRTYTNMFSIWFCTSM